MEYSKNFNFALPSRDNDVDLADINEISNNFRKIDENSVKKEVGKGLSTNDFTDEYKAKVENALTSENIDPEMSDTSENPVQNKAVKKYIDEKTTLEHREKLERRIQDLRVRLGAEKFEQLEKEVNNG